jgi:hypothetical protein
VFNTKRFISHDKRSYKLQNCCLKPTNEVSYQYKNSSLSGCVLLTSGLHVDDHIKTKPVGESTLCMIYSLNFTIKTNLFQFPNFLKKCVFVHGTTTTCACLSFPCGKISESIDLSSQKQF